MSGVNQFTKAGPYKLRKRLNTRSEDIPLVCRRTTIPKRFRTLHSTVVEFTTPRVPTEVTPQEITVSPIYSISEFFDSLDTSVIESTQTLVPENPVITEDNTLLSSLELLEESFERLQNSVLKMSTHEEDRNNDNPVFTITVENFVNIAKDLLV